MAGPLQNRIVGTVIIGALAIIILPDLLSGKNYQPDDDFHVTPLRPEVALDIRDAQFPQDFDERVERTQPTYEGDVIDAPELREARIGSAVEESPTSRSNASDEVATADPVTGDAFTIQLGAFRNADRVQELVRSLRSEGFQAYTRTQPSSSGEALTLLMVGPDLSEQKLREQLPKLKEKTGLDGRIVSYKPVP